MIKSYSYEEVLESINSCKATISNFLNESILYTPFGVDCKYEVCRKEMNKECVMFHVRNKELGKYAPVVDIKIFLGGEHAQTYLARVDDNVYCPPLELLKQATTMHEVLVLLMEKFSDVAWAGFVANRYLAVSEKYLDTLSVFNEYRRLVDNGLAGNYELAEGKSLYAYNTNDDDDTIYKYELFNIRPRMVGVRIVCMDSIDDAGTVCGTENMEKTQVVMYLQRKGAVCSSYDEARQFSVLYFMATTMMCYS